VLPFSIIYFTLLNVAPSPKKLNGKNTIRGLFIKFFNLTIE